MSLFQTLARLQDLRDAIRAPVDTDGKVPTPFTDHEDLVSSLKAMIDNPLITIPDLPAYLDAVRHQHNVGLDDRKLLLEHLLVLMSQLSSMEAPLQQELAAKLQRFVIDLLYKDLPHPPSGYLGNLKLSTSEVKTDIPRVNYAYRSANGSNYNTLFPSMGQAGMPYARSVPSQNVTPLQNLPEASVVFDALLRRKEFEPHPGGISSLFFAFADLVIHSIFNTSHADPVINNTSSYLDLSILYGSSEAEVDSVRLKDGRGRLHEDTFADGRLMIMPPAVGALLILLCRNHNYIADKLLNINERGTYKVPVPTDDKKRLDQDDEIFQRTRLINCGFFMQIILRDYVAAILGLVRDGSDWRLDPLMAMRQDDHALAPRGEGNVVSVEFNLMYRWHATLSSHDTQWTENLFRSALGDSIPFDQITPEQFLIAALSVLPKVPPNQRTFGGLTRGPDGRFSDDDLSKIIQDATDWRAGSFRAHGVPEVLKVIEVMAIEQARGWGTCSLNEFRKFIGLKPYATFEEWNPDETVHKTAARLYKTIDNLELYVGLQAEEAKKPGGGAGLCPGYTISRAILSDAVCLTRGDRFLTTDFISEQLRRPSSPNTTAWGLKGCQPDVNDGSYGGILTRLLFRTLPNHYNAKSVYAHFPFLQPAFLKQEKKVKNPDNYDWERHAPRHVTTFRTREAARLVLSDSRTFVSSYDERLKEIVGTLIDTRTVSKLLVAKIDTWVDYFGNLTRRLIRERSVDCYNGLKTLDIVRDVVNLLPVYWLSEHIMRIPLKSKHDRSGIFYESEIYDMLAAVCCYVYMNNDLNRDWHLRLDAKKAYDQMTEAMKRFLGSTTNTGSIRKLTNVLYNLMVMTDSSSNRFLEELSAQFVGSDAMPGSLFAEVVPSAAQFSRAIAEVVDHFLNEERAADRSEIARLSRLGVKGDTGILSYIYDALRVSPAIDGVFRSVTRDCIVGNVLLSAGTTVYVSLVDTGDLPASSPQNDHSNGGRGVLFGGVKTGLLSPDMFDRIAPRVVGAILGTGDMRRAKGASGQFTQFKQTVPGTDAEERLFINSECEASPLPEGLTVQYTPQHP
ncbi:heme peroxidase [Fistulina hepatica ATCC 64428]|uniref:Heme peroxidase n=1 Tax=Fistulina hepatica ATCC 64428 TaxID=1128425 RepID=A0A0D7AKE1_9AGAR|nr:heme peroxidase [Fistulina hepatica ATCC 64428]